MIPRRLLRRLRAVAIAGAVALPTPRPALAPLFPPEPCPAAAAPSSATFGTVLASKTSDGMVHLRHARVTIEVEESGDFVAPVVDVDTVHVSIVRRVAIAMPGGLLETVEEAGDADADYHPAAGPEPTPTPAGVPR